MIEITEKETNPTNKEENFVLEYKPGKYYVFKGSGKFTYIFTVDTIKNKDYFTGRRFMIENAKIKRIKKDDWYSQGVSFASAGERCFILEDSEAVLFEIVGPTQFLRMNNLL